MADIQRIQCKNHQKTSSCRVPYKEIGIKESNGDVRTLTEVHTWPFLRLRSENMAKIALNAVRLPKFEPVNWISWSPRKIMVKDLRQRSGLA